VAKEAQDQLSQMLVDMEQKVQDNQPEIYDKDMYENAIDQKDYEISELNKRIEELETELVRLKSHSTPDKLI
jgi:predicted  nucleic acid-binding Zn-ribbon protein